MRKFILIVSSLILTVCASAQEISKTTYVTDGSETLYIIDGIVSSKTTADILPSDEIKSMSVVKNIRQAVIISTKSGRSISGHILTVLGEPVFGALVQIKDTPSGVVTDKNGYFELRLPAGEVLLEISFIDYPTRIVNAEELNGKTLIMDNSEEPNIIPVKGTEIIGNVKMYPAVPASSEDSPAPLYLIKDPDGRISKTDNIESIEPENIKSINVYKTNLEQFEEYGDTSNGVVFIELK